MRRNGIVLLGAALVALWAAEAAAVLPARGPRITASGLIMRSGSGGELRVSMDTLIFLHNPNNFPVRGVGIAIFDRNGQKVADGQLFAGGVQTDAIPPKGVLDTSLGMHLAPPPVLLLVPESYTFVIYWRKPAPDQVPDRGLVASIRQWGVPEPIDPAARRFFMGPERFTSESIVGKGSAGYSSQ